MGFCKFASLFADYWSRAQGLSKNVSNVIDLYHNKKIEGGGPSSREPVMKPDIRINRVNGIENVISSYPPF